MGKVDGLDSFFEGRRWLREVDLDWGGKASNFYISHAVRVFCVSGGAK